jgi:hypothetical protein
MTETTEKKTSRGERLVAAVLIALVVLVAFWEIMSNRSNDPRKPYELTSEDFADFVPESDAWHIESIHIDPDPIEPNIVAFVMTPRGAGRTASDLRVVLRLVHGYNMVDCMREKGYSVDLLADTREQEPNPGRIQLSMQEGKLLQVWRLTSTSKDSSLCITSMLRDGDFGETVVDTRSMAFPRIGIPDNPGWFPQGLSWRSLKRPIHNGRLFLRAKWNSSRMDVMTFLRLKQPAWASDDMVTLVGQGQPGVARRGREREEAQHILAAHTVMYRQLFVWRQSQFEQAGHEIGPSQ